MEPIITRRQQPSSRLQQRPYVLRQHPTVWLSAALVLSLLSCTAILQTQAFQAPTSSAQATIFSQRISSISEHPLGLVDNCHPSHPLQQRQHHLHKNVPYSNSRRTSRLLLRETRVGDDTTNHDVSYSEATGTTPIVAAPESEKQIYRSAILRTLGWVGAASLFGMGLLVLFGPQTSEEFFAGYLVEQSLSVDNLFVFLLLFEYFKVPLEYQDRVLGWGIAGAVIMRAVMIGLGAAALQNFHEILLVFAGILVYSSVKVLLSVEDDDDEDPSDNAIVKFSQNLISSSPEFDGDRFFTIVDGVKKATPLFICMIAVEISDVVFAVDSIPAVFGVTENPLVVFSSNMFAIMGLRSLYTILSKAASDLKYLEPAVAVVLGFIGWKMIAEYFGFNIPTELALFAVASLLATGVGLSVWERKMEEADEEAT